MSQLKTWLASDGRMGEAPPIYMLMRGAKYLGVAPWELLKQPVYWLYSALEIEKIEGQVQEWRYKQQTSKL